MTSIFEARSVAWILAMVLVGSLLPTQAAPDQPASRIQDRPDVLFLIVDDLNDWISLLDPKAPIQTPHLERLARRGMLFTRAYCVSPACNPSRTATLTGLRPSTTGIYGNRSDWRRALPDRKTIMEQFRSAGYEVRGAGKIFHHKPRGVFHDDRSFEDFQPMRTQFYPPEKLNQEKRYGSRNTDWGEWPERVEDTVDYPTTQYALKTLRRKDRERPLFLACGFYKPHSPFFAPSAYHGLYRDITLPARDPKDWSDLPDGARKLLSPKKWFWEGMARLDQRLPGSYHDFIRSYGACVNFVDAQIGQVLDALEDSPRKDNTVILLWSDHGFHLGEKDHIEKFALWEKSTRVPFIVVAPGVTRPGSRCDAPVDLSSVYPTLLDLCGLPGDADGDGVSLRPLLRNGRADWKRPAVTTYLRGNHAIRSARWRYIRYADGTEELYDHRQDPHEWTNLAGQAGYGPILERHRAWLPVKEAKTVPNK